MKNRHLIISVLTLVLMVSVFFVSCGVPDSDSFITMENLQIISETSGTNIYLSFMMTSADEDDYETISEGKGPSLLLFYVIGELNSTERSNIIAYLDSYLSNNKIPILTNNTALVTYNSKPLYPFLVDKGDALGAIEATRPEYSIVLKEINKVLVAHHNGESGSMDIFTWLNTEGKGADYELQFNQYAGDLEESEEGYWFTIKESDTNSVDLRLQDNASVSDGTVLELFGAVAPGVGDFIFPFWSDSYYLGQLTISV